MSEDWWSEGTTEERQRRYEAIIWTLHLDGPFESSSGQAAGRLRQALRARHVSVSSATLTADLRHLDEGLGYVQREKNGTRTFKIWCALDKLPPWPFPGHEPGAERLPVPVEEPDDDGHRGRHNALDLLLYSVSAINEGIALVQADSLVDFNRFLGDHLELVEHQAAEINRLKDKITKLQDRNAELERQAHRSGR